MKISLTVLTFFLAPSFVFAASVNAGSDKSVTWPSSVTMSGSTDQTLSGTAWTQKTGPGTATFSPAQGSATPSVSFSEPGIYTLEYCAVLVACDQATVTVNLPTPSLQFDTRRPDCGDTIYTGVTNGGPNATIHYDWTNSSGAWYGFDQNFGGRTTNSSGSMIQGPFPDSGGMNPPSWVKNGTYSVKVRTKKNGMVSQWSSPQSFTFCGTPTLQMRQGSGAWFSGSGVEFRCGSPLYTRISNAPAGVRMFFRWTNSTGGYLYDSTQFDSGKNPETNSNGSVDSGPFPDNGGPTVPPWREGGTYTVDVWSPGGSNSDSQSFTLRCSTPPPPPPPVAPPPPPPVAPPPPPAGPSCNPRTFVRPPSGFYNTAGASITSIARNTPFDILCNYTVGTDDIGIVPVTVGAPNCGWIDFVGTSARFRCQDGIATAGTYTYECKIGGNTPPATANSCYQDNPIGSITVTGGTTPPPPPPPVAPPPPAAPYCPNNWNSTSGGKYDKDGSGTTCGCNNWDACGNWNEFFSPSDSHSQCSPWPSGCATPPPPPPPAAQPADLVVTNDWTNPVTIQPGVAVDFHAIVRNQGAGAAGGSQTSLCLDMNSTTIVTCDFTANRVTNALSPNTSEQEDWNAFWTAAAGTHTYRICADGGSAVTESNESNNCVTRSFTVSAPPPPPPPAAENCRVNYPANRFHVCFFDGTNPTNGRDPVIAQEDEPMVAASATAVVSAHPNAINHNWGTGVVTPTTKSNQVSAIWRGKINFEPGIYVFHVNSDDGVTVRVEGQTPAHVIDRWQDQAISDYTSAPVTITGGPTDIRVRWYEQGGGAQIKLWWTFSPLTSPPPPCGGLGQACCGSSCNGGLVCTGGFCVAPPPPPGPGDLPTVDLISPTDGASVNGPLDRIDFDGDSYDVIPVDFDWSFSDAALGGTQSHRRVYVTDITDEYPVDPDPADGCVVDGEIQYSLACADFVVDFSHPTAGGIHNHAFGNKAENMSSRPTPGGNIAPDLQINLRTNRVYAWTARGRSSVNDPVAGARWSDRFVTGDHIFETGSGILGDREIHVRHTTRTGAEYPGPVSAWLAYDRENQITAKFARFRNIRNADVPTAVFVAEVPGYTEFAGTCVYNRGESPCAPSIFDQMTYNAPDDADFIDDIDAFDGKISLVVVRYVAQCSDKIDNDGDGPAGDRTDGDDPGCHIDGDITKPYNPDDTNEGDEGGGPGDADFSLIHNPRIVDGHNPGHFFSDIQVGDTEPGSTLTNISVQGVGGFTGSVTLRVIGISPDSLPPNPDGTYGNGVPDDPSYGTPLTDRLFYFFNNVSGPKTISAGGSTAFTVRKLRQLQPGRYMIKIEGTATIGGVERKHDTQILLVVGSGTSGYVPR